MPGNNDDIELLDDAMRRFMQVIKRPQRWAMISEKAGVHLDRPSAIMLQILIHHEPKKLGVQDLAHYLGVEAPSVTRKTQALEEAGLLKRVPDPKDRRAVSLQITPSGKNASKRIMQAHRQTVKQALADWPDAERHQFITLFDRFSLSFEALSNNEKTRKDKS